MLPLLLESAPAKINLFLRVTGCRPNGYHELDSLVVFAGVHDRIWASPADGLSLSVSGPFNAALADADNLVLRAARALAGAAPARAALSLEKNLPVASGIGGGSADAAAALRALAALWGVAVPAGLAVGLGADVPVCLQPIPRRMRGIGEVLEPAPALPPFGMALVNPGVAVSTADVFRARAGGFSPPAALPAAWDNAALLARDVAALGNDLQAPAVALCPPIGDVLAGLAATRGCLAAQMSGSGATCFGLYQTPSEAAAAAAACARPGWWCWGGAPWGFTPGGGTPY